VCALNNGYKELYYIDLDKGINYGDELIKVMFAHLFYKIAENIQERNGYNLYAHKFGRFDYCIYYKNKKQQKKIS
jgi:hypothetical protein